MTEKSSAIHLSALLELWTNMPLSKRVKAFQKLSRPNAEELFLSLSTSEQYWLFFQLPGVERRSWLRLLAPDDAADLVQQFPESQREALLQLLDEDTKRDVIALLCYAEDAAGGLMNSRFLRLRPDVTVDVAIRYIRAQATAAVESIHYAYVLDSGQHLLGTLSFRDLFLCAPEKLVSDVMAKDLVTVSESMSEQDLSREFIRHGLQALPVIGADGTMKGIVTMDDIVESVQEQATEEIQKLGGSEALDEPYMQISLLRMIKKRAGWLTVLFLGEMLTATAMGHFEHEIEKAVVLALFIPLIISSGGNSGSQATSLIIRALALGEVKVRDWWRVFSRELLVGSILGGILGAIGFLRILMWPGRDKLYGEHYLLVAGTVAGSLIGVVLWGSLAGSMLPFILRKVGFDPATASAPFVATLVDVTGLIIYFSVASVVMGGTLL